MQPTATPPTLSALPGFPATERSIETPASLAGRGFSLRHATAADLPWLCRLYATTRSEEMAQVPWPDMLKQAFLGEQFALQHRHYVAHYGDSDFLVLENGSGPVGRYYLQRTAPDYLLVDISVWPQMRNRGLGRALIEASQAEAGAQGRGMHLHVLQHNLAAQRLYARLGFVATDTRGTHQHMRWPATAAGMA
jgi:ribosomal protein S18 acetylase RimI-like enzyme